MRPSTSRIATLALAAIAAACATVPITGRTQLSIISDQQVAAAADQNFSQFMGLVKQRMSCCLHLSHRKHPESSRWSIA